MGSKFSRYILTVVISSVLLGCTATRFNLNTGQESTQKQHEQVDSLMAAKAEGAVDSIQSQPGEEDLLNQAKIQYSNALISVYDNDTTGARYHFEAALEHLRQLQEYENLEPWTEDESILFTQKITEDYVHYVENKEEDDGYKPASLQEQISLLEPIEEIEWENGQFKVLDDREGHIPIILNAQVERIIRFLQTRRRDEFQTYLNRMNRFEDLFREILAQYNLPPELFYLALIESGLNPRAYSYAYAAGPWQFISSTGKKFGLERTYWVDERYDPVKSTHAAAKFLAKLYHEFDDWYLAMAAYNSGERRIWRAIRRENTRDFWNLRTLPRQTRNYVPTVLAATIIANHPEEYGFTIDPEPKWLADTVQVGKGFELNNIADAMSIPVGVIKELNPELRRYTTPTNVDSYVLRLPAGTREQFLAVQEEIPEAGELEYVRHRVQWGQTLSYIANRYGVSVGTITSVNNIRNSHWINVGDVLTIPLSPSYSRNTASASRSAQPIPQNVAGHKKLVYIVKRGDTLGEIAEMYNTRAQSIRNWNGLYYGQYIYPGDRLNIWVPEDSQFAGAQENAQAEGTPVASAQTSQGGDYQIYVVQSRDTLWDIARRYDVELSSLRQWNPEVASGNIKPGDRIRIMVN